MTDTEKTIADFAEASASVANDAMGLYLEKLRECNKYRTFLKKIWDRANPAIPDDNSQTRLDTDLMDELQVVLNETLS